MEIEVDLRGGLKRKFDVPECDGNDWTEHDRETSQPFSLEEIKVFYYWHEFLRRSPRSRWNKIVRRDFQTMLDWESAAMMEFDEWWYRYNHLFRKVRFVDVEISSLEKAEFFIDKAGESGGLHLLLFNGNWPKTLLRKKFSEILNTLPQGQVVKGRYHYSPEYPQDVKPNGGAGGYGIYAAPGRRSRPHVQLLRNALEVYDVYCQWENGDLGKMKKYEIQSHISSKRAPGEELVDRAWKEEFVPMPGDDGLIGKRLTKKLVPTKDPSSVSVDGATVARYKKCADILIENVCKGIFPKYLK